MGSVARYQSFSDTQLIILLNQGDQTAYTEIYNRYNHILIDFAIKKLGDDAEAEDTVQELFTKLWIKRAGLQTVDNLPAYLMTWLKNRILDHIEHQGVRSKHINSLQVFFNAAKIEDTDYRIRERQFQDYIDRAVLNLPKKMRQTFELTTKENMTRKEIAVLLNIPEKTVHSQMLNALKKLRTKLSVLLVIALPFL